MSTPYTIQTGGDGQHLLQDFPLVTAVRAGTNITVDNTDPTKPIVSASGGGSTKQFITARVFGTLNQFNQNTTHYLPIDWNSGVGWDGLMGTDNGADPTNNEVFGATYFPIAGTLKNFYFYGNTPGAGQTFTVTVYNGTTPTSATYQVTNADTDPNGNAKKNDLTHTVAVAAGDLIVYQIVTSATSNQFCGIMVCEFDPS